MTSASQPSSKNDWYEALVESAPDAFVLIDCEGQILLVNRQTETLFGYARSELIGQQIEILVPERYRGHHHVHRDSYFTEPNLREMGAGLDLWGLRKDGTEFPVEISLSPVRTDAGHGAAAAIRDASNRKRAQEQFRNLLETAPDAMIIIDAEGKIELVNRQTEAVFGYVREALIGKPVEVLIPERLRDKHAGHRSQYFTAPSVREMGANMELVGRRKNGAEFPIEISLSPLETEQGFFATAAVRDVTERKLTEKRLSEYAHNLERSNKELEQFAYVASHDLQAPLRNVISFSQLLQVECQGKISDEADSYFAFIQEGALRMQSLVRDVMELSRVNKTKRQYEWVCMQSVVQQVCSVLELTLAETKAEVDFSGLPKVWGDKSLLEQLLQNLVSNGIKFQSRAAPPRIEIRSQPDDTFICFEVRDNGIGIAPHHLEKIFEVFQRLHTQQEFDGTGIGLAICRKIVEELHNGRLWAESTMGDGTSFFFTLPAAETALKSTRGESSYDR